MGNKISFVCKPMFPDKNGYHWYSELLDFNLPPSEGCIRKIDSLCSRFLLSGAIDKEQLEKFFGPQFAYLRRRVV